MRHVSHHPQRSARRREGERGVIIPLAALSMVTVLIVIALIVDGSHAYPQRRDMQNAADAAALAGTRALDKVKYSGEPPSSVDATVQSVAADNGAEGAECTVIDRLGQALGPCTDSSVVARADAAGVHVRTTDVRPTSLPKLTDVEEVTARASAAATIQTFVGGTGSPFVVCGNPAMGGWPILGPDGRIDPVSAEAVGVIDLQAAQLRRCGAGASFKGKLDEGAVIGSLPAEVHTETGNGFNSWIQVQVLGATPCNADDVADISAGRSVSCDMLIPIADEGWGNGNSTMVRVVAWAVFHVEGDGHGNPKYWGHFVATNALLSGGQTSTEVPANGATPRVIRLIL